MIFAILAILIWFAMGWTGSGLVGLSWDKMYGTSGTKAYNRIALFLVLGGPIMFVFGMLRWRAANR